MTIRPARDGDNEVLVALCRGVIRSNYATFLPAATVAQWLAGDAVENYTASHLGACHVAEQAGKLVACHVTDGDLLDLLLVHPARQGRGIGRAMLADAEARLFKAHPVIRLESFAANTSTNRFYKRHGWRAAAPAPDPDTGIEKLLFTKGPRTGSPGPSADHLRGTPREGKVTGSRRALE